MSTKEKTRTDIHFYQETEPICKQQDLGLTTIGIVFTKKFGASRKIIAHNLL